MDYVYESMFESRIASPVDKWDMGLTGNEINQYHVSKFQESLMNYMVLQNAQVKNESTCPFQDGIIVTPEVTSTYDLGNLCASVHISDHGKKVITTLKVVGDKEKGESLLNELKNLQFGLGWKDKKPYTSN